MKPSQRIKEIQGRLNIESLKTNTVYAVHTSYCFAIMEYLDEEWEKKHKHPVDSNNTRERCEECDG